VAFPATTDGTIDSWAMFHLERTLELDWSSFSDTNCEPKPIYELYAKIGETGEYTRFNHLWKEFEAQFSTVATYIKSHFHFDENTGSISLEFSYAEFTLFKERFMTTLQGIDFKVVARLSGSQYDGAKANFMSLRHADFYLKFIEPEAANACKDHKLVLTDTEHNSEETREPWIEIPY
jgi:hypothetical protein